MMVENKVKDLCDRIRQTAYDIHVYHGHGHLEKVYENALGHRLRKWVWTRFNSHQSTSTMKMELKLASTLPTCYPATAGVRAINELKPILGLDLTATPQIETGDGHAPLKNRTPKSRN
ncbi:MAG: hypothetical protein EOM20_18545 [Spartobacteria bacterium]|nr:hypothetical protein [Spartobacteria bacterium]